MNQLLPCCGHTIWSDNEGKVQILGCDNGIDFNIYGDREFVRIEIEDQIIELRIDEYITVVRRVIEEVKSQFSSDKKITPKDNYTQTGYNLYIKELYNNVLNVKVNLIYLRDQVIITKRHCKTSLKFRINTKTIWQIWLLSI